MWNISVDPVASDCRATSHSVHQPRTTAGGCVAHSRHQGGLPRDVGWHLEGSDSDDIRLQHWRLRQGVHNETRNAEAPEGAAPWQYHRRRRCLWRRRARRSRRRWWDDVRVEIVSIVQRRRQSVFFQFAMKKHRIRMLSMGMPSPFDLTTSLMVYAWILFNLKWLVWLSI